MHRKGHTRRHTKRHHKKSMKGGFYGADGAIAPGAMKWSHGSEMGDWAVSKRGGNTMIGSSRKRKSHKKTRRHRKQRGGAKYGAVSASYQGRGSNGIIDVVPVNTKGPAGSPAGAALGAFNDNGAQPGSGHSSFVRAH
jgi:hypothetical protein